MTLFIKLHLKTGTQRGRSQPQCFRRGGAREYVGAKHVFGCICLRNLLCIYGKRIAGVCQIWCKAQREVTAQAPVAACLLKPRPHWRLQSQGTTTIIASVDEALEIQAEAVMLVLVLVLVLKDSLRTKMKSLSLFWSLRKSPGPGPGPWHTSPC